GASGSYVNQYSYLPFGQTTTTSATLPNPFTYVGDMGVLSIGNGVYSMRARTYSASLGTFLSNDPLGLAGGDANLRRYAGNNPLSFVDPEGLRSFTELRPGKPGSITVGPTIYPVPGPVGPGGQVAVYVNKDGTVGLTFGFGLGNQQASAGNISDSQADPGLQ